MTCPLCGGDHTLDKCPRWRDRRAAPIMPPGFDSRTRMAVGYGGDVVIAHPEHSPHVLSKDGREWIKLDLPPVEGSLVVQNGRVFASE